MNGTALKSTNKSIAIIPARSGSKRIPNKNIKLFMGQPIISYTIATLLESEIFDQVLVSTDSCEIRKISETFGAETLDLRPGNLSDDNSSTMDVMKYELRKLAQIGCEPEFVACVYPATPLLNKDVLKSGLSKLIESKKDFCIPIVRNHVSSGRLFQVNKDHTLNAASFDKQNNRTQDYVSEYRDAGQFYFGKKTAWENSMTVFSEDTIGLVVPEYLGIDIDSLDDWELAKMVFAGKKYIELSSANSGDIE